jgi:hypothetical protein
MLAYRTGLVSSRTAHYNPILVLTQTYLCGFEMQPVRRSTGLSDADYRGPKGRG